MKKLLIFLCAMLLISVVSANIEDQVEVANFPTAVDDINTTTMTLNASEIGFIKAIGIKRGNGGDTSNFTVFINQSGTNLATTKILNVNTASGLTYVNLTGSDYNSMIQVGEFTIELHVDQGDVEFQFQTFGNFTGTLFNLTEQQVPAQSEGPTLTYASLKLLLKSPINNSIVLRGVNQSFNMELNQSYTNLTMFIDGVLNETILSPSTSVSFFKHFSPIDVSKIVRLELCDALSCDVSDNFTYQIEDWLEGDRTFPNTALSGDTKRFSQEINTSIGTTISSASFIYDGTAHTANIDSLETGRFNVTIDFIIPSVASQLVKDFNWNVTLSTGEVAETTTNSVTVDPLNIDACSVHTNVLYNFTAFDEQDLRKLIGTTDKVNASLNLQIYDDTGNTLVANFSNLYSDVNPFAVCLEESLTNVSDYTIDLEVQYSADPYTKEFFVINGQELTSDAMNTNISLFPLHNDSSQIFTLIYKDSSFLPVPDAVIQVQRKYISEGLFRTVEQPKTDNDGQTLAHLERDDVLYSYIVLLNGQVQAIFNNIPAICQNPTFTDCEISLLEVESGLNLEDFANLDDLTFNIAYNGTSREVSSIFSVVTGSSASLTLNVTLFDSLGNTTVCDDSLIASSGTLLCTVPNSFGNSTVIADLYKDGSWVGRSVISLEEDPTAKWGFNQVIVAMLMVFTLMGISLIGNPIISAMFLGLSGILITALNLIGTSGIIGAGATILWFVIAVIVIIIKGASR